MNEDQIYDAAEREMDLYRGEITRITAERDTLRRQLAESQRELGIALTGMAEAAARNSELRYGIERTIAHLEESAASTEPSKKSAIEVAVAGRLRTLLEQP